DVNFWVAFGEREDERRHYLPGSGREGVDPQGSRGNVLKRSRGVDRPLDIRDSGADPFEEEASRIGQGHAARGAVEEAHTQMPLELADGIAVSGGRHRQLKGRAAK